MIESVIKKFGGQALEKLVLRLEKLEAEVLRMAELEARLAKLEQLQGSVELEAENREPTQLSIDMIEIAEPAPKQGEESGQLTEKAEAASLNQELEETAAKLQEANFELANLKAQLAAKDASIAQLEEKLQEAAHAAQCSSVELKEAISAKTMLERHVVSLKIELDDNKEIRDKMEASLNALQRDFQDATRRLDELSLQNEVWHKLGLDGETGARMLRVFASVDAAYRQIVESCYDLNDCLVFASQCGVVARLRQCWEGCRELALAGTTPSGVCAFLELALEFYNRAFPNNPCQLIQAESGEDFDYHREDRVGPQGRKVESLALPGFIMPNGSIGVKALVKLK